MVSVKLEGRLGNQLFQYAFIYATAKKLGTGFYLDKQIDNFYVPRYFKIDDVFPVILDKQLFSIKGYKNLFSIHAKKAFYKLLGLVVFGNKTITISNDQPIKKALQTLKNNHLYTGVFHSESYFEDYKDNIRALYQIKNEHIATFEGLKKNFDQSKKKIVIHIRRSDYVKLGQELPLTYYKKAIEAVKSKNIQYILISDDPTFCEQAFSYLPNKYISKHSEIIDLQFLIHADVCILSNSSFSWWGAWLNTNPNKQIFAPKDWLGFKVQKEYPTGVADGMNFNWIEA